MKCSLLLSIDHALDEKWNKTIPGEIPRLIGVTKVERKQKYIIYLYVYDFSVDKTNFGQVIADITITGPDTAKYLEVKDCKIDCSKIVNPAAGVLHAVLEGSFEPKDQLGKYKVRAHVRDLTDNTSMTLEKELELVEFKVLHFPNREEVFNEWFNTYNKHPAPDKAIGAFFYWLSTEKYHHDVGDFPPMFAFFLEIFRNNAYLVPHLIELFEFQDDRVRSSILYALVQLKIDVATFFNSLRGKDAADLEEVSNINWDYNPYQELTSLLCDEDNPDDEQFVRPNNQLDILWGTFFASGSYKPIQWIIETLKLKEYAEYPEKFKGKTDFSLDEIHKVQLGLAFQAAEMSLNKYCAQYDQVRIYCTYHRDYTNPPEPVKTLLTTILEQSTVE